MPIDTKDLRIDNWVIIAFVGDRENVIAQVDSIEKNGINRFSYGHAIDPKIHIYEYIEGLPLSAKILEDVGFLKVPHMHINNGVEWWDADEFQLEVSCGKIAFYFTTLNKFRKKCEVEYLHELQNLYYTITKKELTYNP